MIEKDKQIIQPIDYEGLRQEAMEHIANYSSDSWTDYNSHDPGVTIMEILCFAMTELGLRANLPIKDLVAELLNKGKAGFYPAQEILSNMPLTENDYRKLLIDMDGVKNVWLSEIEGGHHSPIYVDTFNKQLTLMSEVESCYYRQWCKSVDCTFAGGVDIELQKILTDRFKGKSILLTRIDFQAVFDEYKNLNKMEFKLSSETLIVKRKSGGRFSIDQSGLGSRSTFNDLYNNQPFIKCSAETTRQLNDDEKQLLADLVTSFENDIVDPLDSHFLEIFHEYDYLKSITFTSAYTYILNDTTVNGFLTVFPDVNGALCFSSHDDQQLVCRGYYHIDVELEHGFPKDRHDDKLADIHSKLNQNRNLCELFPQISIVEDEYVYLCVDIEVANHADAEKVLSEVVYHLDSFINPDIHFYSLKQMRDKSYLAEDIFNGPLLVHGFIDDNELETAVPKETLHASDLIQEIMNVDNVLAVKKLMMSSYHVDKSGKLIPVEMDKDWVLPLDVNRATKLLVNYTSEEGEYQSEFVAYKGYLPYRISANKLLHNIYVLKSQDLPLPFTAVDLIDAPIQGQVSGLDYYHSIRNHFPMNYALKDGELPKSATDDRKAKVLQLRAFLLFFDQILANSFQQLSKLGDLLSFGQIEHTYFTQYTEMAEALKDLLTVEPEAYLEKVQKCSESEYLFDRRRNLFLNHLLARFGEEFNDYYALAEHVYGDQANQRLIRDKERILNNIVPWSAERFCAENIMTPDMTPVNISGLEYRLRVFLGMAIREFRESAYTISTAGDSNTLTFKDDTKTYLYATVTGLSEELLKDIAATVMKDASHMTIVVSKNSAAKYIYQTERTRHGVNFLSHEIYDTWEEAQQGREECLEFFLLRAKYQECLNQSNLALLNSGSGSNSTYQFTIADRHEEFLCSNEFETESERLAAINLFFLSMKQLRSSLDNEKKRAIEELLEAAVHVDFDDRQDVLKAIKNLLDKNNILGFSNELHRIKPINKLLHKVKKMDSQSIGIDEKKDILWGMLNKNGEFANVFDLDTQTIVNAIFSLAADSGELAIAIKTLLVGDASYFYLSEDELNKLIVNIINIIKNNKLSNELKRQRVLVFLDDAEHLPITVSSKNDLVARVKLGGEKVLIAEKKQKGNQWSFTITLNSTTDVILESPKLYKSEYLVEIALYEAVDFLVNFHFLDEMYIFEHILLLLDNSIPEQTLPVHLDSEGETVLGFDPYSFRLTLVLPGETELLGNMQFRQYFEKYIREATPSHIFPKICWVSNDHMLAFEEAYKNWRQVYASYTRNSLSADMLDDARAHLLEVLNKLESIYDKAILGGGSCNSTGEDKAAVVLGHTKLGSKNGE